MATGYVIFNPLAGNGKCEEDARLLEMFLPDEVRFFDMTRITNYSAFISGMEQDDYLVIAGGDGTLNRFANDTAGIDIRQEILYFPTGTCNGFAKDLGKGAFENPFPVTQYLTDLPSVEVKGKRYRFINGVGLGMDGFCYQVGDERKKIPGKKVNYAAIAIKGLLFRFDARNAAVTVDGKEHTYKKVWSASTMLGKYAPDQNRLDKDGKLSLMMIHGAGRLRTLCIFPSIFKGEHVKHHNVVAVHTGHKITVEFDRPTPLQIDGETVLDVTGYTASSAVCNMKKAKEFAQK